MKRNDILVAMSESNSLNDPPQRLLPVLERIKQSYLLWHTYHAELPKLHRYSLGARIDTLFIEIIEAVSAAAFLSREEKLPYVRLATRKVDALKLLCMILWETKSLETRRYIALSEVLGEVGKMLGGWNGQLLKNSSPPKRGEK